MAINFTTAAPGVYVQPIYDPQPPTSGAATSITAFLGRTLQGPVNEPVLLNGWGDYQRTFGGLSPDFPLSYQVSAFFNNGGGQAVVVRLFQPYVAHESVGDLQNAAHDLLQGVAKTVFATYTGGKAAAKFDALAQQMNDDSKTALKKIVNKGGSPSNVWVAEELGRLIAANPPFTATNVTKTAPASQDDVLSAFGTLLAKDPTYPGLTAIEPLPNFNATLTASPLTNAFKALDESVETVKELVAANAKIGIAELINSVRKLSPLFPGPLPANVIEEVIEALAGAADGASALAAVQAQTGTILAGLVQPYSADAAAAIPQLQAGQTWYTGTAAGQGAALTAAAANALNQAITGKYATAADFTGAYKKTGEDAIDSVVAAAADADITPNTNGLAGKLAAAVSKAVETGLNTAVATPTAAVKTEFASLVTALAAWNVTDPAPAFPDIEAWVVGQTANAGVLVFEAVSPGSWASDSITVYCDTKGITDDIAAQYGIGKAASLFNLTVSFTDAQGNTSSEAFLNVTADTNYSKNPRYLGAILAAQSRYLRYWDDDNPGAAGLVVADGTAGTSTGGYESEFLSPATYLGNASVKTGLYALEKTPIFNILSIPPDKLEDDADTELAVYQGAAPYCVARNAMLIVDPPAAWSAKYKSGNVQSISLDDLPGFTAEEGRSLAVYFPRLKAIDPLTGQIRLLPNSGYMAGQWAQTDSLIGVWKAPAGLDNSIAGIAGLEFSLNDAENGQLNSLGINCLRTFPNLGTVVWGARTFRGNAQLADQYNYIPVRRLELYIADSLLLNTKWAVFEDNDPKLWASLTQQISTFMLNLWKQGALFGTSADQAFTVQCDASTTTADDRNNGIVNVKLGFSPVKPAEFVYITIRQLAQTAS